MNMRTLDDQSMQPEKDPLQEILALVNCPELLELKTEKEIREMVPSPEIPLASSTLKDSLYSAQMLGSSNPEDKAKALFISSDGHVLEIYVYRNFVDIKRLVVHATPETLREEDWELIKHLGAKGLLEASYKVGPKMKTLVESVGKWWTVRAMVARYSKNIVGFLGLRGSKKKDPQYARGPGMPGF